jgi:molybdopterin synthase sulfur carrier subunit
MKVEVRYFASLTDRTGVATESIEVDDGATVARLWDRLVDRHPSLADVKIKLLVACDMEYAAWDRPLSGVKEVAFLPPMSGG